MATLQGALTVLSNELNPNQPPVSASTQYRKSLAINLFYKVSQSHWVVSVSSWHTCSSIWQCWETVSVREYPITQPMSRPRCTSELVLFGYSELLTACSSIPPYTMLAMERTWCVLGSTDIQNAALTYAWAFWEEWERERMNQQTDTIVRGIPVLVKNGICIETITCNKARE